MRLKRDIEPAGILANGVHVYSFRYWNDDRVFIGPMAQELLADERFRHAVSQGAEGYYRVDFGALGLEVPEGMGEAGQDALTATP
jgi:hypothetical protein